MAIRAHRHAVNIVLEAHEAAGVRLTSYAVTRGSRAVSASVSISVSVFVSVLAFPLRRIGRRGEKHRKYGYSNQRAENFAWHDRGSLY
jgi:hypothetical protein